MGANKVIAGDYQGKTIIIEKEKPYIFLEIGEKLYIDKETTESYEVITDDITKSAVSGIARGVVGAALLGPVGLLAGLSAKNKGIYTIAIKFKDGKSSLIEVDDKCYKAIVTKLF